MRRQRHSRSSASYAEGVSDDDDFAPPVRNTRRSIPKRNAVEDVPKSTAQKRKERPNPKERAEAMQLERAIRESLNDVVRQVATKAEPTTSLNPEMKPSIAFQCLLDVTYEEGCYNEREEKLLSRAVAEATAVEDSRDELQKQSGVQEQQQCTDSNGARQADSNSSHSQNGVRKETKENILTFRRVRKRKEHPTDEVKEEQKNEQEASDSKPADHQTRISSDSKLNDEESDLGKALNSHASQPNLANSNNTAMEQVEQKPKSQNSTLKCFSRVRQAVKKPEAEHAATEAAGLATQPSSLHQRRVVGLSRRFRPPSLHPYLTS